MPNILAVAGANSRFEIADSRPAGFWAGFWHGIISPITFVASLFYPGARMYETRNVGRLYDFGFLFGVLIVFGGSESQAGYCRW
ncbi:MAG TPA: hypothetical protein VJ840_17670 [Gemmatimonadaceae bacterium]|nr:hypothetical protein [Gemmatimonadaceae bacterium]